MTKRWCRKIVREASKGFDRGTIDRSTYPYYEQEAYQGAGHELYVPSSPEPRFFEDTQPSFNPVAEDTENTENGIEVEADIAIHHPEKYYDVSTYSRNFPLDLPLNEPSADGTEQRFEDLDGSQPLGRDTSVLHPQLDGEEGAYGSEYGFAKDSSYGRPLRVTARAWH